MSTRLDKGVLVKRKDTGELGIVTAYSFRLQEAMVFWGNGLESHVKAHILEPMLFRPGAIILADFIELVEAQDRDRGQKTIV